MPEAAKNFIVAGFISPAGSMNRTAIALMIANLKKPVQYPEIEKLMDNPKLIKLREDEELVRLIKDRNFKELLDNDTIAALLKDKELLSELKNIDIKSIIERAKQTKEENEDGNIAFSPIMSVVTVYEPDPEEWINNKIRR